MTISRVKFPWPPFFRIFIFFDAVFITVCGTTYLMRDDGATDPSWPSLSAPNGKKWDERRRGQRRQREQATCPAAIAASWLWQCPVTPLLRCDPRMGATTVSLMDGQLVTLEMGRKYSVGIRTRVRTAVGPLFQCYTCLLYTSPSPRDLSTSRMPSSA